MAFFHYSQNNSGGSFNYDEKGITHHVDIEAPTAESADRRAESIGLYFDGAGDCPCCGDRWSSAYGDGDAVPSVYSEPLSEAWGSGGRFPMRWMKPNPEAVVHFLDGRIEWFSGDGVGVQAAPSLNEATV
jgi:hypothetical protein